jgi:general secretion pathway protein L
MSTLIVHLPIEATGAAPSMAYSLTIDGVTLASDGMTTADLLPTATELVAVVPAACLAWHAATLPTGTLKAAASRQRSVLEGLLEEQLLDEPAHVHLALPPKGHAYATTWIAACQAAWLTQALAPLRAAGRAVHRIVPEAQPLPPGEPAILTLLAPDTQGTAPHSGAGWAVLADTLGVMALPVHDSAPWLSDWTSLANAGLQPTDHSGVAAPLTHGLCRSEPSMAGLIQGLSDIPVLLETAAERRIRAANSRWNLAQFGFSSGTTLNHRLRTSAMSFAFAPLWAPVRWGLLALATAHLIGLNAWAWHVSTDIVQRKQAVVQTLTQTFASVKVVIDAPVQMEREIVRLRQSRGASTPGDLTSMLAALAQASPAELTLTHIDYTPGEARVRLMPAPGVSTDPLPAALERQGYRLRRDGDVWVISVAPSRELH